MAVTSYHHQIRKAAFKKGVILPAAPSSVNSDDEILTRLYLLPSLENDLRQKLVSAVNEIAFTSLKVNIIGTENEIGQCNCFYF